MDILLIGLCTYIGYKTNVLAKQKGQNSMVWSILAIFCFFMFSAVGALMLLALFYDGDLVASVKTGTYVKDMNAFFRTPSRVFFTYFAGAGGYLLIRYILERMPDKKIDKIEAEE